MKVLSRLVVSIRLDLQIQYAAKRVVCFSPLITQIMGSMPRQLLIDVCHINLITGWIRVQVLFRVAKWFPLKQPINNRVSNEPTVLCPVVCK